MVELLNEAKTSKFVNLLYNPWIVETPSDTTAKIISNLIEFI